MLAAERRAARVNGCFRIDRIFRKIRSQERLGDVRAVHVAGAEAARLGRSPAPAVLMPNLRRIVTLQQRNTVAHSRIQRAAHCGVHRVRVERLPGDDADLRQTRDHRRIRRQRRVLHQRGGEQVEECGAAQARHDRRRRRPGVDVGVAHDPRRRLKTGVAEVAERYDAILLLNRSDRGGIVARVVARAREHPDDVRRRAHDANARRQRAFPAGTDDRVVGGRRVRNARRRIGDDVGPRIHYLGDEIASGWIRNVQHLRLLRDVDPGRRIPCVAVGCDDDAERRCRPRQHVDEGPDRRRLRDDAPRDLHQDQRIPVDEAVTRDRARIRRLSDSRRQRRTEQSEHENGGQCAPGGEHTAGLVRPRTPIPGPSHDLGT